MVSFILQNSDQQNRSYIFLAVYYAGAKVRIATGLKVPKKYWGTKKSKIIVSSEYLLATEINQRLSDWENIAEKVLCNAIEI